MNISSVIVIPQPGRAEEVVAALGRRLEGVEVAAVSPEGKIIATIEADGDRETVEIYEAMSVPDRVLSSRDGLPPEGRRTRS
ncbi:MAG: chaperone NapD [Burkholderiales bacterium]|nr:chaperone NapD [Burkholderiales bacterium]